MSIEEGGSVINGIRVLGQFRYSAGKVTVTGPDSVWRNTEGLMLDEDDGDGTVTIAGSGTVRVH